MMDALRKWIPKINTGALQKQTKTTIMMVARAILGIAQMIAKKLREQLKFLIDQQKNCWRKMPIKERRYNN